MDINLLALTALVFYFTAGLLLTLRLINPEHIATPPRALAIGMGFVALGLHFGGLYQEILTPVGLNLSFFNAVALVSWMVSLILMVSALTKPVESLGIVLLPLAGLAIIMALRFPSIKLMQESELLGLNLHVLLSLLAYSLLLLAAVQAVLLSIQERHLHNRKPGGFVRLLPPLQTMESLLFEMIGAGFFLLGLALISGFVFLENMLAQHLLHKTVLSIISWLVFAALLWGRFRFGWRGRTAIKWTLSGFGLLMLAYFGTKAVLELILHR